MEKEVATNAVVPMKPGSVEATVVVSSPATGGVWVILMCKGKAFVLKAENAIAWAP